MLQRDANAQEGIIKVCGNEDLFHVVISTVKCFVFGLKHVLRTLLSLSSSPSGRYTITLSLTKWCPQYSKNRKKQRQLIWQLYDLQIS